MRKVKLTYFKESGKYYSEGEYDTDVPELHDWEIYKEVREMNENAWKSDGMPGLVGSWKEGHILVEPENGVPHLIVQK